jgi:Kef-type K+ transport system membrane component KefB
VAILGTFLPIICGTGLALAYGFEMIPSLSAGVSLAPTSVGIALKLLNEAKALSEYFGQAVMTAAFVDDVLSLIIFSVLFTVGGGDPTIMDFVPLVLGCIFMAIAIPAAVLFWPPFLDWVFRKIPETKPDAKLTRHDEVMFLILFTTLILYGQITFMCGTHLWGCFIAGMSFATRHEAHHVWVRQVKRNTVWFLRIFFSCTLAWSIPVKSLFSIMPFLKGSLMGIGPCIACKVFCGPFMGDARWVIGWAMVGRAEFAYFIAIYAKSLKMMDDELFAILVWSLLYATVFAPLVFRKVLARYMLKKGRVDAAKAVQESSLSRVETAGHLPDNVAVAKHEEGQANKRSIIANEEMLRQYSSEASAHASQMKEREAILESKDEEIKALQATIKQLEADGSLRPMANGEATEPVEFRTTVSSI